MALKRKNPPSDPLPSLPGVDNTSKDQNAVFDYVAEQQRIQDALSAASPDVLDSIEKDNIIDIPDEASDHGIFVDQEDEKIKQQQGHTSVDPQIYEGRGFDPAIQVRKPKSQVFEDASKTARPATELDLEHLDESMIMNMPSISSASFELIDMLNPKPKDKSMRFRWANYKNHVAGNLGKYLALGFTYATPEDVDQSKMKLDPSLIEGTHVQYYDIVLLKIPVLRLMQLYKSNIIRSLMKLGRSAQRGVAEANRQFAADLSTDGAMVNRYNQAKQATGGVEPVQFYTPGAEESNVIHK